LCKSCNLFGYGEIKPGGFGPHESSMMSLFQHIQAPNFEHILITRKEEIWPSFRAFLARDRAAEK